MTFFHGSKADYCAHCGKDGQRVREDDYETRAILPDKPFGDVIARAYEKERKGACPPLSLKPQAFMRQVAHAALPLGEGVILDPFAGSGSALAAAEAVGYTSIGIERDPGFFSLAREAIPKLARLKTKSSLAVPGHCAPRCRDSTQTVGTIILTGRTV